MKTMLDYTFWNDPDFDMIDSIEPLAVYLYLCANEGCTTVGCYRLSARKAVADTRLDRNQLETSLELLSNGIESPKIMYDKDTSWIWVRGLFGRNYKAIKNVNTAKNVVGMIDSLRASDFPFMDEFDEKYSDLIKLVGNRLETVNGTGTDSGTGKGRGRDYGKEIQYMKDYYRSILPEGLGYETFQPAYDGWIEYRYNDKRKPLNKNAVKRQLKRLDEMGTDRAIAMINYTIERFWEGLRENDEAPKKDARPLVEGDGPHLHRSKK